MRKSKYAYIHALKVGQSARFDGWIDVVKNVKSVLRAIKLKKGHDFSIEILREFHGVEPGSVIGIRVTRIK